VTQIIKTSTPGTERDHLSKAIVITIRAFLRQQELSPEAQDMLAFVILALEEIAAGIDKSVAAWEKRDYWVKADKYRMEWHWTGENSRALKQAFDNENWSDVMDILVRIMQKFENIKVSDRHRMGQPWKGAFVLYKKQA
jgi:hypothetical protein